MTLRRTPQDFRVEERTTEAFRASLAEERLPSHPFAAYELEKISLTTPDALGLVAERLRVPRGAIAAAGLKDRHAVTRQTITVDCAALRGRPATEAGADSWRVRRIGFSPRAADASIIARNAFTIVVRGLVKREVDEMSRRAETLAARDGDLRFTNYFGDQRFGSARHGQGFVAKALVRGDFESALRLAIGTPARKDSGPVRTLTRALANHWGDWSAALASFGRMPERGAIEVLARGGDFREAFAALPKFTQEICVEAYQSFLWNAIARELAEAVAETMAQRASVAEDLFGAMVFPRAAALTPALDGLALPLPSPRCEMPECARDIADGVLADEGLSYEDLRIPGLSKPFFGGGARAFIARASECSIGAPEPDEFAGNSPANLACRLRFTLPRGSYATVLLRALGQ